MWYCYFWGGRIHLLRGREAVMQWFGRCRSLEIKRLDSHGIGEEMRKWQCANCIVIYWEWGCDWHFLLIFTLALQKMTKWSYFSQFSLQFTASLCHWIVYEGVLALDTTIFDGWHCEYDHLWYGILRVKILKWKMTISHEVEWSRSSLKMFRDHNNILEKDASVRSERGMLFLLLTLHLFVQRTIHAKCNKLSYLSNQSSNDEARTCPELAMT